MSISSPAPDPAPTKFDPPGALESAMVVILGQNALTFSKALTLFRTDPSHFIFCNVAIVCSTVLFGSISLHWLSLRHIAHTTTVYGKNHLIFDIVGIATYAVIGQVMLQQVTDNTFDSKFLLEMIGGGFFLVAILNWCWNTVELRSRNTIKDAQAIITIRRAKIMNIVSGSLAITILMLEKLSLNRPARICFIIWSTYWIFVLLHYLRSSLKSSP